MIGAFRRWIRVVLPPSGYLWLAGIWCLVIELLFAWLHSFIPRDAHAPEDESLRAAFRLSESLSLAVIALAYGVYRVAHFHPRTSPSYFQWLQTTPWRVGMPLPLGPLYPVPQDALVVGLLTLPVMLREPSSLSWLYVPCGFLLGYAAASMVILRICREWQIAYALAIGLPVAFVATGSPLVGLAISAVLVIVARVGLHRSLRSYPWKWDDEFDYGSWLRKQNQTRAQQQATATLGWPYDVRSPEPKAIALPRQDAVLGPLVIGWYLLLVSIVFAQVESEGPLVVGGLASFVVLLTSVGRLNLYVGNYRWPISLWGRIRTGHWIIPGYDRVLVAPLLGQLIVLALPWLLVVLRVPAQLAWPLSITLALLILANVGPRLGSWQLVGTHRQVRTNLSEGRRA